MRVSATDINDQGRVIGVSAYYNPAYNCTSWQPVIGRGIVWAGAGVLTEFGGLPHTTDTSPCVWTPSTQPVAINNAGTVLGLSEGKTVTAPAGSPVLTPVSAPCTPNGIVQPPVAINDTGTVVLQCNTGARLVSSVGAITDLPGFTASARGLTPSGVVLGRKSSGSVPAKAIGSMIVELQPLPGYTSAYAEAIADDGTVVGQSRNAQQLARDPVAARRHAGRPQHDGSGRDRPAGQRHRHLLRRRLHHRPRHRSGRADRRAGLPHRHGPGHARRRAVSATALDGRVLGEGGLTESEAFDVHVTLKNTSTTQTIKDIEYAGGAPLTIDGALDRAHRRDVAAGGRAAGDARPGREQDLRLPAAAR